MFRFTIFSAVFLIAFGLPLRKLDSSDETGPEILAPSDETGPEVLAPSDESEQEISASADESGPEIFFPSDENGPEIFFPSDENGPEILAPSDESYEDAIDFDAMLELAEQDPEFRQALSAYLSAELQYEQSEQSDNQIEDLPSDSNEGLEESEDFETPLKIDSKVIEEHMKNAPKVEEHMKNAPKVEQHGEKCPEGRRACKKYPEGRNKRRPRRLHNRLGCQKKNEGSRRNRFIWALMNNTSRVFNSPTLCS